MFQRTIGWCHILKDVKYHEIGACKLSWCKFLDETSNSYACIECWCWLQVIFDLRNYVVRYPSLLPVFAKSLVARADMGVSKNVIPRSSPIGEYYCPVQGLWIAHMVTRWEGFFSQWNPCFIEAKWLHERVIPMKGVVSLNICLKIICHIDLLYIISG